MKRPSSSVAACALALVLGVAGAAASTRSHATALRMSAPMSAAQEVPAPTGDVSAARGTFTATATKSGTGAMLAWQLTFSGLTGRATAAHIHIGARGVAGPVSVPLCGPCEADTTGTATVNATVLQALQAGLAYANVHTPTNRAGEIRGQVAVVATVRTALSARQEVPRPKGNVRRARGTFTATVTKSGTRAVVAWRLRFGRLTGRALAAHIHVGRRGRAGPVVVALCGPCRNGARGRATGGARLLNALDSGRAYVNVHTRRNAAGEIRGQLRAVPLTMSAGSS